jgi:ATP-dependent DNA helicase PIF1
MRIDEYKIKTTYLIPSGNLRLFINKNKFTPRQLTIIYIYKMSLNEDQKLAIDIMKSGKSIFLTGGAGVGKSYIVQTYYSYAVSNYTDECVFKTSSTGVSAIIIGGTTIHKFGGILLGEGTPDDIIKKMQFSAKNRWRNIKVLFIDEISMIHPALFDKLENIARILRRNEKPFGGIQIICSGDFFQLPPVCKDGTDRYCFESLTWDSVILHTVTLTKIMRQKDERFQGLLNDLRYGIITKENEDLLISRIDMQLVNEHGIEPTVLFSKNVDVNYVNNQKLKKILETQTKYEFNAKYTVMSNKTTATNNILITKIEELTKDFIQLNIILAVGVQVVFKKNINEMIANGTRGVVISFHRPTEMSEEFPVVKLLNGNTYVAIPEEFEYEVAHEYRVIKKQVPLKLAFAVSCHSSQGSTLDYVKADVGTSIFSYGQMYVSLSRVKSIEGLTLIDYDRRSVKSHPKVLARYPRKV